MTMPVISPKNRESLNQSREQLAQLHRLRVELHNALLRWIRIRVRTREELESLSTKLHKRHRNIMLKCYMLQVIYQTRGTVTKK